MSHEINSIAYQNATPWHKLGNRVDWQELENLEPEQKIAAFQKQAGLDWRILERTISYRDHQGQVTSTEAKKILIRSDNGFDLSVVGMGYKVVQPYEIMQFFTDLIGEGVQIDVAGALDSGRKIWCLASNDEAKFSLGKDDVVRPYIQLVTSCDGSIATHAYYTSVRVVCANTLRMSERDMQNGISISHRSNFDASAIKQKKMGMYDYSQFAKHADRLASTASSEKTFTDVMESLFAVRDDKGVLTRASKKAIESVLDSVHTSPGARLPSSQGTLWGLLNGITHHVDFKTGARNDNNRFKSSQFGNGASTKSKAYDLLTELAVAA